MLQKVPGRAYHAAAHPLAPLAAALSPYDTVRRMGDAFVSELPAVAVAVAVVLVAHGAGRGLERLLLLRMDRRTRRQNLGLAAVRLVHATTVVVGVLVAATIVFPSFTVGNLIQLLGIGVVTGVALNSVFQNVLAGILVLVTNPFVAGDRVTVGALGGLEGTVEELRAHAAVIRTGDGRRVVIPNGELFTKPLVVQPPDWARPGEHDLRLAPGRVLRAAEWRELKRVIRHALLQVPAVRPDPKPSIDMRRIGNPWSELRLRWWSAQPDGDAGRELDRVLLAVGDALHARGVAFHSADASRPEA